MNPESFILHPESWILNLESEIQDPEWWILSAEWWNKTWWISMKFTKNVACLSILKRPPGLGSWLLESRFDEVEHGAVLNFIKSWLQKVSKVETTLAGRYRQLSYVYVLTRTAASFKVYCSTRLSSVPVGHLEQRVWSICVRVVPSTFFIDFPSTIELTWYKVKSTSAPGELRQYQVNRSTFLLTLVRRLVNVKNRHFSNTQNWTYPITSEMVTHIHIWLSQ